MAINKVRMERGNGQGEWRDEKIVERNGRGEGTN